MILLCDHKEKITEEMCDPKVRTMRNINHHFTKNKTKSNIFTTKINPNDPTLTLTQGKQKGQNPSDFISSEQILLQPKKKKN